jgi:hypothetical protein
LNTITLTFAGLICHVLTTGNIERAVFVNAPTHDAQIAVPAADVVEVHGLVEEPSPNPSERVFAINDQHLTLNSGRTERTVADMSFARFVPAMATISDMTGVRDEVEDGVLFEGAHAYLDFQEDDSPPMMAHFSRRFSPAGPWRSRSAWRSTSFTR